MTEIIFLDRPTHDAIDYAESSDSIIIIRVPVRRSATKSQIFKRAKAVLQEIGYPNGHRHIMTCIDVDRDIEAFRLRVIAGLDDGDDNHELY